ncbi:MAG: hypothetical protein M3R38_11005 [Actinomycetota bacterium]|nr:hypothetical protein [Actinomycetota bacterium]
MQERMPAAMDPAAIVRTQLEVAERVVDSHAEMAKAFFRIWGPWGEPAINLVEVGASTQRQYLECLRTQLGGG